MLVPGTGWALDQLLAILIFKGYLLFFLWILGNRLGLPLPATPALLAAGALAGMGEWRIFLVLLLAVLATLMSDSVWFELGRRYGNRILRILYRLTPQPELCARHAEGFLARHGMRSLLVTKFIPGMNRTVLPLTGTARVSFVRFLTFDFFGALVWASVYCGAGYLFSDTLEQILGLSGKLGWYAAGVGILLILVSWFGWNWLQRKRRLRDELAAEHVTPGEVVRRLDEV